MRVQQVTAADGRGLRLEVAGDGQRMVVAHVGSPNAGVLYDRWAQDAVARGLTLLTYDRPGYGGSSSQLGRTVADCAVDVRTVSESLGFDRCVVWGFSGGGPHALACAALLGDLVAAAATIGSPAPSDAPDDRFALMSDEARIDHELFLSNREEWERDNREQRKQLLGWSLEEFTEQWSIAKSDGDRAALRGEFGAWLYRAVRAGLAPGDDGWTDDDIAVFRSPWGFDPGSISIPVKVWHGLDDRFVPIENGRWLADHVPAAEAELRDHDGHFGVAAHRIAEVHQ